MQSSRQERQHAEGRTGAPRDGSFAMEDLLDDLVELFTDIVGQCQQDSRHLYYPLIESLSILVHARSRPGEAATETGQLRRSRMTVGEFLTGLASETCWARQRYPEACRVVTEHGLQKRCAELGAFILDRELHE